MTDTAQAHAGFYRTSGTLHREDRCYVVRQADSELSGALSEAKYCYVLTARQMGKSSLTVRAAARLGEQGVGVAVVDLTAIGQNLSAEQWYGGVLAQIGRRLGQRLEDELLAIWEADTRHGPLQRWMLALQHAMLSYHSGPLVIFIDEVDAVLSLPFSTDEFFAGIREFYNRRSEDAEMKRLTFCLLGVATPSQLIRDSRTTPFNIGHRIELHDFTNEEAKTLAHGLGRSEPEAAQILDRVLYWTGGHPYLTQCLCQAVAEDSTVNRPEGVDHVCAALFFTPGAREQDDNLLFVRERLLRSEVDLASLLTLYAKVRRGRRVIDDQANPLVSALRLSGIVRAQSGGLIVRNRIYARVFDLDWVKASMPDAELRRQRRARLQGAMLATAISAIVVLIIAALAVVAMGQRDRAVRQEEAYRRLLYTAQIGLAQQAYEVNDIPRVAELLEMHRPAPGQEDLRRFEWYYLKRYSDRSFELPGHTQTVYSAAISPDGRTLATGGMDKTVRLWDVATRSHIRTWNGYGAVRSLAFSPDGRVLAAASEERLTLWDVPANSEIQDFGQVAATWSVAWSPDGKLFAVGSNDGAVRLWDVKSRQLRNTLQGHTGVVSAIVFSPDSRLMATVSYDNAAKIWDVATAQERSTLLGHTERPCCVVFSPDGKRIATGAADRTVRVWDLMTKQALSVIHRRSGGVHSLLYLADGKMLAIGGPDGLLTLWDLATDQELDSLKGHRTIWGSALSPDGTIIATTGGQGSVRLWHLGREWQERAFLAAQNGWKPLILSPDTSLLVVQNEKQTSLSLRDVVQRQELGVIEVPAGTAGSAAISGTRNVLALGARDGSVRWWDLVTRRQRQPVESGVKSVSSVALSASGNLLAVGGLDGTGTVWDLAAGRRLMKFDGRPGPIYSLAFSPDSNSFASGAPGVVKLWELSSGREAAAFRGPWASAWALAFSPDGRTLAAGLSTYSVQLWDLASKRELSAFKAHFAEVLAVTFSPDGKRLATGSSDNTVRLWDIASAQPLLTLRDHGTGVTQVAFSADGSSLASVSVGRSVRFRHTSMD